VITGKVLNIAVIFLESTTLVNGSFMSWMGRAIKWFIYQKDLLMVLALEAASSLINVGYIIRNQREV
jgi:hypothetical protein